MNFLQTLAADREHGAAELAQQALAWMAELVQSSQAASPANLFAELAEEARELASARHGMAPIRNLLNQWLAHLQISLDLPMDVFRPLALQIAEGLGQISQRAANDIAQHARELIPRASVIFTHSYSSTVERVFTAARNLNIKAIVTEARPGFEGRRLARVLAEGGIPVTFITEAQTTLFIGESDLVIVGADTILKDGTLVHKAGTCLIALAALQANVPFYVCCESLKLDREHVAADVMEEFDPEELEAPRVDRVTARNHYFDLTPPQLIAGYITERGLLATIE